MRGVANVPVAVFDPRVALEQIERERITVISGPPTLFATLMNLDGFDPKGVASLRLAFVGAAAVPTELIRAMQERPVPDMIYRTATVDRPLGAVTIKKDETVVLSIASVTTEILSQGRSDISPIFGGLRSDLVHPTHACPAYNAGFGLLLGMVAALVEHRALRPMGYPMMRMEVLPQPVTTLQAALQSV